MMPIVRIALVGMVTALMYSCGTGPGPMQAGSETTSGVEIAAQGTTIRATATPGAKVSIFDERYNPEDTPIVIVDSAIADDSGRVTFNNLPSGKYNVFVYAHDSLQGAAALGIPVKENSREAYADTETFASLRTITGTVTRQGKAISSSQVFIAGSPYNSKTDIQGGFSFQEVPAGDYSIKVRELNKSGYMTDSVAVRIPATGNSVVIVNVDLK
jgi:hypothetical protein